MNETDPSRAVLPDAGYPSVAVVVPVYRQWIDPDEERSLRHLETFLGRYDRYFIAPRSLAPRRRGFSVTPFPDACFESVDAYSGLLLSVPFYRAFEQYRHILVYQLDCLVFSDMLSAWCAAGHDYVGAPWLVDPTSPGKGFLRVGNGGFSLRRVESFLRVLEAPERPAWRWPRLLFAPLPDLEPWQWLKRVRIATAARRGPNVYTGQYTLNEDRFWSDRATLFHPGFRVAPVQAALGFSFERAPRYCYERNGHRLPFGCHAWQRWDRRFWEPHLLT